MHLACTLLSIFWCKIQDENSKNRGIFVLQHFHPMGTILPEALRGNLLPSQRGSERPLHGSLQGVSPSLNIRLWAYLFFLNSCFFPCEDFLAFWAFFLFPGESGGLVGKKTLVLFGCFSCLFRPKKQCVPRKPQDQKEPDAKTSAKVSMMEKGLVLWHNHMVHMYWEEILVQELRVDWEAI